MRYYGQIQVSHEFKQPFLEMMGWPGPITHRQYITLRAWLDMQWNQPSRSDYYVMQLDAGVRRIFAKNPNSVTVDKCKIEFFDKSSTTNTSSQARNGMTKEVATAYAKARLGMMLKAATDGKFNVPESIPIFKPGTGMRELNDQFNVDTD